MDYLFFTYNVLIIYLKFYNGLVRMSLVPKNLNQKTVRELSFILIIKIILLMIIKNIWFDAPTIPKDFDNQVAERIAGNPSQIKETR